MSSRRCRFAPARRFVLGGCLLLFLLAGGGAPWQNRAAAQDITPPKIESIRVGFDGFYKVGYWTPVEVTVRGGTETFVGDIDVRVPDGDGVPTIVSTRGSRSLQVLSGRSSSALLYVKIGQVYADIEVDLRVGRKLLAERSFEPGSDGVERALSSPGQFLLVVGAPILRREETAGDIIEQSSVAVNLPNVRQLPTRWYGYEGIDTVVLTTSDQEMYRSLNNAQVDALKRWVQMGGRLLMSVGKEAGEILAPGAPLAVFAPGEFGGTRSVKDGSALESYVENAERLAGGLEVAQLLNVRGAVEAHAGSRPGELPLVVRWPFGFGEVTFATFDLDQKPVSQWKSRPQLVDKLLRRIKRPEQETDSSGQVATVGYNDLSGQLRAALDQFTGVQLVPFALVALLIVIYILCIGPLDYFLVKKVLKRMELTWITFPTMVVAFSLGAYLLAYWLKGDQLRLNQVDVIDVDVESGLLRGTHWSKVFSPRIDSYNLSLAPTALELPGQERNTVLSWLGLPGNAFGGMNAPGRGGGVFGHPYAFAPGLDALEQVPIAVWSTKGFTARWRAQSAPSLEATLRDRGDELLGGTIESNLNFDLDQCVLLYGRWALPLGNLASQGQIAIDERSQPRTIDVYLKSPATAQAVPFSPDVLDPEAVLNVMMFYESLGGRNYTGLGNAYQGFLDMSAHLKAGQAILLARGKSPAAKLIRDGQPMTGPQDRYWSFYRFVIPVEKSSSTPAR